MSFLFNKFLSLFLRAGKKLFLGFPFLLLAAVTVVVGGFDTPDSGITPDSKPTKEKKEPRLIGEKIFNYVAETKMVQDIIRIVYLWEQVDTNVVNQDSPPQTIV